MNEVSVTGEIPEEWRNATVIPIVKRGEKKYPKNYRHISLLKNLYPKPKLVFRKNIHALTLYLPLNY